MRQTKLDKTITTEVRYDSADLVEMLLRVREFLVATATKPWLVDEINELLFGNGKTK